MILVSERFVFLLLFIIIFFFWFSFLLFFFVCFDVVVVAVAVNFVCFWLNVTFCFSSTNIFLYYWLFYICFASFYIKYHSKEKKKTNKKHTHNTFYCWCVSLISFLFLRFTSDYLLLLLFIVSVALCFFFWPIGMKLRE